MGFRKILFALMALVILAGASSIHVSAQVLSSSTSNNTNSTYIAVNLTQELNNSYAAGFNLTKGDFQSNSSLACVRALIDKCDNNNPSQFVCLNSSAYNQSYLPQKNASNSTGYACPQYFLAGVVGCATQNNYCVVVHEPYPMSPNTTNSSTGISTPKTTQTTIPVNVPYVGSSTINGFINGIINFFENIFKSL